MRKLSDPQLRAFLSECRKVKSVDFYGMAAQLGHSWLRQIKPRIESDEWFRDEIFDLLACFKYMLLQKQFDGALMGKRMAQVGDLSYMKAIIQAIDSGTLTGEMQQVEPEVDERAEEAHKKRLGIEDDKEA